MISDILRLRLTYSWNLGVLRPVDLHIQFLVHILVSSYFLHILGTHSCLYNILGTHSCIFLAYFFQWTYSSEFLLILGCTKLLSDSLIVCGGPWLPNFDGDPRRYRPRLGRDRCRQPGRECSRDGISYLHILMTWYFLQDYLESLGYFFEVII